jgi:hypothetical protein
MRMSCVRMHSCVADLLLHCLCSSLPVNYCIKGLVINELYGLDFHCEGQEGLLPNALDPRLSLAPAQGGFGGRQTCQLQDGHDVLALYDMDVSNHAVKWYMTLWVSLFFIGFNVLAVWALLKLDHSSGDSSEVPNWGVDVRDHSTNTSSKKHTHKIPASTSSPTPAKDAQPEVAISLKKRLGSARQSSILAPEAYISWNNLCYTVKLPRRKGETVPVGENKKFVKRKLLNNCFGFAQPKNMVALMGPSGELRECGTACLLCRLTLTIPRCCSLFQALENPPSSMFSPARRLSTARTPGCRVTSS